MAYAICGASGTGKTTLAKRVSDAMGIPFHEASFGRIARELGYDSVAPMDLAARMEMQERCLVRYGEEVGALPRPFVSDRCPLDLVGYTMAEVGMHAGTDPAMAARLVAYAAACVAQAVRDYEGVIVARPLDRYEASPHRPPPNAAYQAHVQLIIEGALAQADGAIRSTVLRMTGLEARTDAAKAAIGAWRDGER